MVGCERVRVFPIRGNPPFLKQNSSNNSEVSIVRGIRLSQNEIFTPEHALLAEKFTHPHILCHTSCSCIDMFCAIYSSTKY